MLPLFDMQLIPTRLWRRKITAQQLPDRVGFGYPRSVQKVVDGIEQVLFYFSLHVKRGSTRSVDRSYKITDKSNKTAWNLTVARLREHIVQTHESPRENSAERSVNQEWTDRSVNILKKHRLGKYSVRFAKIAQILNDAADSTVDGLGRCVMLDGCMWSAVW